MSSNSDSVAPARPGRVRESVAKGRSGFGPRSGPAAAAGSAKGAGAARATGAARPVAAGAVASAPAGAFRARGHGDRSASSRTNLMRYAADNRFVRGIFDLTTGPLRFACYAGAVIAVAGGLYFPVRDLYVAYRSKTVLEQQLAIRQRYNAGLKKEVDAYFTTEGIEDAARALGYVKPGEQSITVTGTGSGSSGSEVSGSGSSSSSSSSGSTSGSSESDSSAADSASSASSSFNGNASTSLEPSTSAEVQRAQEAVYAQTPWYLQTLDRVFSFSGVDGQTISSTGGSGK